MAELSKIQTNTTWSDAANVINNNNDKINAELTSLKSSTTNFKGYFTDVSSLQSAYPNPKDGQTAWVGSPYPGTVYKANSGSWTNTSEMPSVPEVELNDYYDKTQVDSMMKLQDDNLKESIAELENETIPNNIANNNKISPFILINKYDMKENGWYKTNGEVADSNSSFQRVDYPITEGAKYAYCRNVGQYSGFAICFMNGDTLLKSINSVNEIIIVDMSLYPTCTNIRISTQKSIAEGCFVLLDYVSKHPEYTKEEIDTKINELNSRIEYNNTKIKELNSQIGLDSVFKTEKTWGTSGNFYATIEENLAKNSNFIVRCNADVAKLKDGSTWSLAVTALDESYYYIKTDMAFNEDIEITANKDIVKFEAQINRANSYKEEVDVEFLLTISNNGIIQQITELNSRLTNLEGNDTSNTKDSPSLHICDTIDCIVGDTIQLYYNMFIHHVGEYSLNIECHKGKNYPRYWEYTPTSSDVGITKMKIQLLNIDGSVIEERTINIVTKNAVNPASPKNILLVGDSLYMSGQIAIELSRRLKGTTGIATSPSALSLSNFNVVGRLKNSDDTVGWEGTGGWSWSTYTKAGGMAGVRLTVSGITDVRLNQDCRYKMDEYTQNFYITEINVVDGTGYIFAAFYGQGDIYKDHGLMPQSGTLKRITGEGQEEIIFTASQVESYQPFWNNETDSFDIKGYVDTYCDGHLEILCVQLGINSIIGANPFTVDFNITVLEEAKKFIDLIHSQLPDTKIYLATLPLPSQNGGIGANYAADSASGSYLTTAWNYKVHKVNDLYRSLAEDENYNHFVSVIDVCSEMDSDYNYPGTNKPVNTRVKSKTEVVGNNGVHPNNDGYYQIADTWFRAVI